MAGFAGKLGSSNPKIESQPAPIFASVTPDTGNSTGGTDLAIAGSNLSRVRKVVIGTRAATDVRYVDGEVRCKSPIGKPDDSPADITLYSRDGTYLAPDAFTFAESVDVESIEPADGTLIGGTQVVVTLANGGAALVESIKFGFTDPITDLEVLDDRRVRVTTPANLVGGYYLPGAVDVVVDAGDYGDATAAAGFTFTSPVSIDSVSSISRLGGDSVEIVGSGFSIPELPLTFVNVGGVYLDSDHFVVVDNEHLTFTAPEGMTETHRSLFLYIAGDPLFGDTIIAQSEPIDLIVVNELPGTSDHEVEEPKLFTGSGFTGMTGIDIGGQPCSDFGVDSDGAMHATSPLVPFTTGTTTVTFHFPEGDLNWSAGWELT